MAERSRPLVGSMAFVLGSLTSSPDRPKANRGWSHVGSPNWGFYGYLGAGHNAWAYDAHDGAIVARPMTSIRAFQRSRRGFVAVSVDLVDTMAFDLHGKRCKNACHPDPPGSTVIPAATLLKRGQVVTIPATSKPAKIRSSRHKSDLDRCHEAETKDSVKLRCKL